LCNQSEENAEVCTHDGTSVGKRGSRLPDNGAENRLERLTIVDNPELSVVEQATQLTSVGTEMVQVEAHPKLVILSGSFTGRLMPFFGKSDEQIAHALIVQGASYPPARRVAGKVEKFKTRMLMQWQLMAPLAKGLATMGDFRQILKGLLEKEAGNHLGLAQGFHRACMRKDYPA
jgi:hypothetical protein